MKHTYAISGMTCNGCRTNAEDTLNNIKGVLKASVNLDEGKAEVEMGKTYFNRNTSTRIFKIRTALHYNRL